ncbi:MAG: hypothetical protein WEC79_01345 [Thermomicrobiales bacterium]
MPMKVTAERTGLSHDAVTEWFESFVTGNVAVAIWPGAVDLTNAKILKDWSIETCESNGVTVGLVTVRERDEVHSLRKHIRRISIDWCVRKKRQLRGRRQILNGHGWIWRVGRLRVGFYSCWLACCGRLACCGWQQLFRGRRRRDKSGRLE